MKKSLQRQILVPFMLLIFVSGIALTIMSYQFSVKLTVDNFKESTLTSVKAVNGTLDQFMKDNEKVIHFYADHQLSKQYTTENEDAKQAILSEFKEFHAANSQLLNSYFATEEEEMLLYPAAELPADYKPTEKDWYKRALEFKGQAVWQEPYVDLATGKLVITAIKTVESNGKVLGVMGIDISVEELIEPINSVKIGDTGYVALFDQSGKFMAHPKQELLGADQTEEAYYKKMKAAGNEGSIEYSFMDEDKVLSFVTNEKMGWIIAGTVPKSEFEARASTIMIPLGITLILILVTAVIVSFFITRRITKPIQSLQGVMKQVEEGDLTVVAEDDRKDEIGQLAKSFNKMTKQIRDMMAAVSGLSVNVTDASQTLVASAEENTAASNEVATTMQQIAAGSASQTELMEENARAIGVLGEKIQGVEVRSNDMAHESTLMLQVSEEGMNQVKQLQEQSVKTVQMTNEMVQAIQTLDERSKNINEIVNKITDIANQTNLLALNAAIEAARAGEHGRGFAVVADEVRKLAEQSETALLDIANIIGQMQAETSSTVNLIEETSSVIHQQGEAVADTEQAFSMIQSTVGRNNSMIAAVTESMKEITAQKDVITSNTDTILSITQETAAGTEETSASVEQQTASMEQLNQLAEQLDSYAVEMQEELRKFKM